MSNDFENHEKPQEEESFADLLESYGGHMNEDVRVGDRIRGEIIAIGRDAVFVDTGTKIDGVVDKEELVDEEGNLPYKEGDTLELYVVSRTGNEIRLSRAVSGVGGLRMLEEAFENGVPVEGKVKGPVKGGLQVDIMNRRAFCPISQIDLKYVETPDEYVGKTYPFLITQFEENGRNIVLSRRRLLYEEQERERKGFLESIAVGALLQGRVTKLMPYGVFVELFPGIEGMVHISEISWSRLEKPEELLKLDDMLTVKVLGLERDAKSGQPRISLSIKQVTGDPWDTVREKFHEGDKVMGTVRRCADFGAFVEIAPGIEGLVHISEMSFSKRVLRAEDVVRTGESVSVVIKEIDSQKRRVSLSIRDAEGDPWADVEGKYRVGQVLEGTFEKKEKFGLFVTLEPGITGLLPQSKIREAADPGLFDKMRLGDGIPVVIEEINPVQRKVTLGPADGMKEGDWRPFAKNPEKPFGSLGEKLQKALAAKGKKPPS